MRLGHHKKWLLLGLPLLAVGALVLAGVNARRGTAEAPAPDTTEAVTAAVTTLQRQPTQLTEAVPGTVAAIQRADLSPKVMGRLAAVYVRAGDHVQAGQLLARLEGNDLRAAEAQAQAGVRNAEAAHAQARTGYTLQQSQSAIAVQQAQTALDQAKTQLAKAKQGPRPEQVVQADEAERRAKAAYEGAAAQLAVIKEGARTQQKLQAEQGIHVAQGQVAQSEAGLATAKANLANVQADHARMSALFAQDIIPKQRLDALATQLEAAKGAVQQAAAAVAQAKAGLEIAKAQASLVQEGARSGDVLAAEKQVDGARAAYEAAKQEALMAHRGGRWEDIKAAEEGVRQADAGLRAATAAQGRDAVSAKEITRAAAGIAQAKAGLSGAQTMVDYTAIVAPFAGVITARTADPGSMAMPQAPILTIEDDSLYQLITPVPERLATRLTRGARVQVTLDALGRTLPATIAAIIPSTDPSSRTLTVKANLPRAAGVQSGLFGRLVVTTGTQAVLTVPLSAIVDRNGLTGVYTVDAGERARFTLVTLGTQRDDRVQILSGLQDGQRVITSPTDAITAGQRIRAEGAAL
jgi:RND family efflux transporter MFP subunit